MSTDGESRLCGDRNHRRGINLGRRSKFLLQASIGFSVHLESVESLSSQNSVCKCLRIIRMGADFTKSTTKTTSANTIPLAC